MKKYILTLFLFPMLTQNAFSFLNNQLEDEFKIAEPKLTANHSDIETPLSEKHIEISDNQLKNNKNLIENFIHLAIDEQKLDLIPDLLQMYQNHENQDSILKEYAIGAYYHSIKNYGKAIEIYSALLKQYPELDKVRFKLAEWLLEDHQNHLSYNQLALLKLKELPEFIQKRISLYQNIIKKRKEPRFKFRMSYIQDNNINNASSEEYINLGNITFKKQKESLPQKAQGLNYQFTAEKTLNIINNHNIHIENDLSGKYYWNNKQYNETENELYIGYQYQNAHNRLAFLPFYNYQWLSEKRHSYGIGGRIEFDKNLTSNLQFSSVFEFNKTKYKNTNRNKYKQLYSTTLIYIDSPNQYLLVGADFIKETTFFRRDSSERYSTRLGIQQIWQNNIEANINLQYAKRYFKDSDYFLNYKRKDNEWVFSTTISKKDWHILGFSPKFQYRYQKIASNIPNFFSFQKHQVNLFFEKMF